MFDEIFYDGVQAIGFTCIFSKRPLFALRFAISHSGIDARTLSRMLGYKEKE